MADISTYLKQILSAVYGEDVRQAIHDAIQQCYTDGSAGAIDLTARESIETLESKINEILESGTTAETVEAKVEAVINEMLNDGTLAALEVETDATLSESGVPADAAVVGEKITELESNITPLTETTTFGLMPVVSLDASSNYVLTFDYVVGTGAIYYVIGYSSAGSGVPQQIRSEYNSSWSRYQAGLSRTLLWSTTSGAKCYKISTSDLDAWYEENGYTGTRQMMLVFNDTHVDDNFRMYSLDDDPTVWFMTAEPETEDYYNGFANKTSTSEAFAKILNSAVQEIANENATSVNFCDLGYTDENGIVSESSVHMRNADKSLLLATDSTDYVQVTFSDLNIACNGRNPGIWVYCDGKTVGAYGTATENGAGYIKITVNGTYSVERYGIYLNAGMHYYIIPLDRIDADEITRLDIYIKAGNSDGNSVSFYLDSIEFGFKETMPHIIFDFDSSHTEVNGICRTLFNQYRIPYSFQEHIRENGAIASYSSQEEALLHMELIADGAEYCTYSQYHGDYHTTGSASDYDTDFDDWYAHFKEGWNTGSVYGIFAPTFLNAATHNWGDAYNKAAVAVGYLGVRGNQLAANGSTTMTTENAERVLWSNFDQEYRHVTPVFLSGILADSTQQENVIALIDRAIELGQNILISSHAVVTEDEASGTMYTGETAMENIIAHVREKADEGLIKPSTWAGYVADVCPSVYGEWLKKKECAEHNWLMNEHFTKGE